MIIPPNETPQVWAPSMPWASRTPTVSSTRSTAMYGGGPTASKTHAPLTGRLEYETV
jgi:hypothetical protein